MDDEVVHEFDELPDFSTMEVEEWGWPKNWGICTIGSSLRDQGIRDYSKLISHHEINDDESITTHYYKIPPNVKFLMSNMHKEGGNKVRESLRALTRSV